MVLISSYLFCRLCFFYSSFWPAFLYFQLNGVFALSKSYFLLDAKCILKRKHCYSSHSSYLFPFATLLFLSLMSEPLSLLQAFVISFTSDFIPRMVYQYMYSPDGSMHGFVNHTLSYFNVSHFQDGKEPMDPSHFGYPVVICR